MSCPVKTVSRNAVKITQNPHNADTTQKCNLLQRGRGLKCLDKCIACVSETRYKSGTDPNH